jgi:hypothetical protein
MSTIDNVDIGTVTAIEKYVSPILANISPSKGGNVYRPFLEVEHTEWRVEALIVDPTQANIEEIRSLATRPVAYLDITDQHSTLIGYGRITAIREMSSEREADVFYYELMIQIVSAIGTTRINQPASDFFLIDRDFMVRRAVIDPQMAKCNVVWEKTGSGLKVTYELYAANYSSSQTVHPVLEIEVGKSLQYLELYGWKSSAWSQIGVWGVGGLSWGASASAWTDEGGIVSHVATVDKGLRNEIKTIGKIGNSLGCNDRALVKITNFIGGWNIRHFSNDYDEEQLLLKIVLKHGKAEPTKDFPFIHYITGGVDLGAV